MVATTAPVKRADEGVVHGEAQRGAHDSTELLQEGHGSDGWVTVRREKEKETTGSGALLRRISCDLKGNQVQEKTSTVLPLQKT